MSSNQPKCDRTELVNAIREIIFESTTDPAEAMIAMGETLQKIGTQLKGRNRGECLAVLQAVQLLL